MMPITSKNNQGLDLLQVEALNRITGLTARVFIDGMTLIRLSLLSLLSLIKPRLAIVLLLAAMPITWAQTGAGMASTGQANLDMGYINSLPMSFVQYQTASPVVAVESKSISIAQTAEGLYKQSCASCHLAGIAGAPKFGDKAAWSPRIALGVAALTNSAIKGKNAMPARGGSSLTDEQIRQVVIYMTEAAK